MSKNNIYEVSLEQLNKLGDTKTYPTTYEAKCAQVSKLGGDLTQVHDIYTAEKEILEHITGGTRLQEKTLDLVENTDVTVLPDAGYGGLSAVTINTSVQPKLQVKRQAFYSNQTVTIKPDEGYDGLESVVTTVDVNPTLQGRTTTLTTNGTYTIEKDSGYDGMDEVAITTDVQPVFESKSITENGTYTAAEGYDGIDSVTVDVTGEGEDLGNFKTIGYDGTEGGIREDIAYSKTLLEQYKKDGKISIFQKNTEVVFLPKIDTSKIKSWWYIFESCEKLISIPELDYSSCTQLRGAFQDCRKLIEIPSIYVPLTVETSWVFNGCSSLTTAHDFYFPSATDLSYFFSSSAIKSVGVFYIPKAKTLTYMFNSCSSLTTVGGFTNLGQAFTSSTTLDMSPCPLSSDSITNIANTVYDMNNNTSGGSATLKLKSTVYAALTDEQKELFASKNWTVTA